MINLERLKKNLDRLRLNNDDLFCEVALMSKTGKRCEECEEVDCNKCQFRNLNDAIDYLLQEHKEPIKLKQWEYDLLTLIDKDYEFCSIYKLRKLREKGHFKGITNTLMDMEEILNDCIIVSDDYEGFEECK